MSLERNLKVLHIHKLPEGLEIQDNWLRILRSSLRSCGPFPFPPLQIAMGVPLNRVKDIRVLYGESPWADAPVSFEGPSSVPVPRGHVIAARITSENPDEVTGQDSNCLCF